MSLIIVKQGQWAVFDALRREFADEPRAQVIWDRRGLADRRQNLRPVSTDHRRDERRGVAGTCWTLLHYLVAQVAES
jgi:hypothetical protein